MSQTQTQEIAKQQPRNLSPAQQKFQSFAGLISSRKSYFANVLPQHVPADRFAKVVIAALSKTPALLNCSQETVMLSITQAAQLGLEPTGVLGSAYLVPYGNKCELVIGYRGLIDLARRSGQIRSIEARVVHERDRFHCSYGLTPKLEHEPDWSGDAGELRFVYAVAHLADGAVQYEVMSKAQIDKVRAGSKAGKSGPWVDHYEEMARKTVIRRLAKYLPLSVELQQAIEHDNRLDAGVITVDPSQFETEAEVVEQGTAALPPKGKSRTQAVKDRLHVATEAPADEPPPPTDADAHFPPTDEIPEAF